MQRFTCECGNVLFFNSSHCLKCDSDVGYDPTSENMLRVRPGGVTARCENGVKHGVCNWLVPAGGRRTLCVACRTNHTIPDLGNERNLQLWGRMEAAKRRLFYTLLRLGLKLPTKAEDPKTGLAFDIVSTVVNPAVTTGHLNGVITLNLEEADDTYRQINRQQLGENSRTLLRHFRHEIAHYFWQRFLSELEWGDPLRLAFRDRFGDEWLDYGAALSGYYKNGAPAGWEQNYITAYAASHPWEDWAETWAHYLQIVDGLETCESLGIQVQHLALPLVMLPGDAGALPGMLPQNGLADGEFLAMLQRWMCLSTVLNEVSQSLGEGDLYPFVISSRAAQKLRLVHYFAQVWGVNAPKAASTSNL
ncbi:MAG: zinc-binding metallopeptidase family protein [Prosthecobacter sp.]